MAEPATAGKRAVLYARVSTEDQDTESQMMRLRDWAKRFQLEVVGEFKEVASGRLVRRPEQDKIMSLVRGRHTHIVAVVKLDRWGRSLIDLRNSVDEMVHNGVTFHAIESGIAYEKHTAFGKLNLTNLASFAEFEAELISDRTKEALAAKLATGKPWVSKTGRTVSKLGRDFIPCQICGAFRDEQIRGKRNGKTYMMCRACKGLPPKPAPPPENPTMVQDEIQVQVQETKEEEGQGAEP